MNIESVEFILKILPLFCFAAKSTAVETEGEMKGERDLERG